MAGAVNGARPAGREAGDEPMLIGVDDIKTPPWAKVNETILGAGMGRMLRAAPTAMGLLIRLAWRASPRLTLLAAVVELAAGCVTAFGLLATANVFTQLLEQGPTPQRVVAALPASPRHHQRADHQPGGGGGDPGLHRAGHPVG